MDFKAITGLMRADIAIAQWTMAASVLDLFEGDAQRAKTAVFAEVGHGLTLTEADLIAYLIGEVFAERNRG